MNPRFTALFTDIGGVLLTNGWDNVWRRQAAERFGLECDEMNERHHLTFDTYEVGKLGLDEYLERVVFHKTRNFSREEFKDFMFSCSRPLPDMAELVMDLKRRHGLRVVAVSNEGRELTEYRVKKFRLGEFIDFFISSCYVHFRKPDRDIFHIALDAAQVAPEQVVYIDDRLMFVEVARGLGITGIHHTGAESTRKALAGLGLM
jgi:putative hydrolase of the HAD superfamily